MMRLGCRYAELGEDDGGVRLIHISARRTEESFDRQTWTRHAYLARNRKLADEQ